MSQKRIRDAQSLSVAVSKAVGEVRKLLEKESNVGWNHDHIGLLNSTLQLLEEIEPNPKNQTRRRDLGRLVTDNSGTDFPESLENLLLEISTANLRD